MSRAPWYQPFRPPHIERRDLGRRAVRRVACECAGKCGDRISRPKAAAESSTAPHSGSLPSPPTRSASVTAAVTARTSWRYARACEPGPPGRQDRSDQRSHRPALPVRPRNRGRMNYHINIPLTMLNHDSDDAIAAEWNATIERERRDLDTALGYSLSCVEDSLRALLSLIVPKTRS